MADNLIMKEGRYQEWAVSGASSGDPVLVKAMTGVALTDTDASGNISVDMAGVYDLSVKAIDDDGNVAVAKGDKIYYVSGDTPVLSKKSSGHFFGFALEAITSGSTATINVMQIPGPGPGEADLLTGVITNENFESNPATSKIAGGAAGGTAGDENVMVFGPNAFEYHILGTQTITAPSLVANGLDIGMDQTADDGVEISQGITARSKAAFAVGTSPAFYAKCKLKIADVSGSDDLAFGFRKAEAYQANVDDYDEMAALNVISGDIKIETILNAGATTTTDTTDNWADTEEHTLTVKVSAAGVVTYEIDGAAPTVTAAFTFDSGEVVVPFLYFLNHTDLAGEVALQEWEVGLQ